MAIGAIFWILFIIGAIFVGVDVYRNRGYSIPNVFFWVLIFLLGWGVFGSPIK